ncbi:hypothetical protein C8R32_10920 [Nitrosospira sp. Nsp5]|nr:hypothetical protein C8R32_10920 [Nitrosospira sp. Nsp5]
MFLVATRNDLNNLFLLRTVAGSTFCLSPRGELTRLVEQQSKGTSMQNLLSLTLLILLFRDLDRMSVDSNLFSYATICIPTEPESARLASPIRSLYSDHNPTWRYDSKSELLPQAQISTRSKEGFSESIVSPRFDLHPSFLQNSPLERN